jgi:diguanylate cyclase (GGDEF)-like protein/PAS domain S-box-containing protein
MVRKMPKRSTTGPTQDALKHSRDLLLALSRAAQSIQRARTDKAIYQAVGVQIKSLGGEVSLFMVNDDELSFTFAHTSFASHLIQRVEKVLGNSAIGYRLIPDPDSKYFHHITAGKTIYVQRPKRYFAAMLPKDAYSRLDQYLSILKIEQSIFAPLRVDNRMLGVMIVSGLSLTKDDVPAMESFAGQVATSLVNVRLMQKMQTELVARRQAEEELQESQSQFRAMFEQMAVGVAQTHTPTGKFVRINQRYCDIVGYTREEMEAIGFEAITHPQDLRVDLKNLQRLKSGAIRDYSMEKRYIHKNGSIIWVELTVSPMWPAGAKPDYHIVIVQDITARKLAEEKSHLQTTALETAANAIAITDRDGALQWVNQAWVNLTGYSREEAIGKSTRIVKSGKHDAAFYKTMWDTILSGETWQGEVINKRKDGSLYFEEETITPVLDAGGNVANFIAIKLDVTERKQKEEELQRAKERLEIMNHELQLAFEHEQRLAHIDGLTGINNRRYLFELADHEFDIARRYQQPLSVIMFDLDHFKDVNDSFGHIMGDKVLRTVIQTAEMQLRDVDLIGRYGGEEFVIVMPMTKAQQAHLLAERIRSNVAALRVDTGADPVAVTLSIGIAEFMPQDESVEAIIRRADEALYMAKQAGRNRTEIFGTDGTGEVS